MLRIRYLFCFLYVLQKNLASLAKRQRVLSGEGASCQGTNERGGTCSSFHWHVKEAGVQVELSTNSQEWTPSHQHWHIHQYPKGQALESFWDAKCLEGGVSREVLNLGTYISPWALSSSCSPCQTLKKKNLYMHVCEDMHAEFKTQISFEEGFLFGQKHSNYSRLAG